MPCCTIISLGWIMGRQLALVLAAISFLAVLQRENILNMAIRLEDTYFPLEEKLRYLFGEKLIASEYGWALPNINASYVSCTDLAKFESYPVIGKGYTKTTLSVNGTALKISNKRGKTMMACLSSKFTKINAKELCELEVREAFLQEVTWLHVLQGDRNVPKLISYCASPESLSIQTSLGVPLTTVTLLSVDHRARLDIFVEIVAFLLRHRDLEFRDFRRQQFVLNSRNVPLLVDFDDVAAKNEQTFDDAKFTCKIFRSMMYDFLLPGSNKRQLGVLQRMHMKCKNNSLSLEELGRSLFALRVL